MSVVWNGKTLDWFKPTRGIRQGDAISPYLFVLSMEILGRLINNQLIMVCGSRSSSQAMVLLIPFFFFFFFAGDLIHFAKAFEAQMSIIMECLNQFYTIS